MLLSRSILTLLVTFGFAVLMSASLLVHASSGKTSDLANSQSNSVADQTPSETTTSAARGSSGGPVADYQFDGNLLSENPLAPELFETRVGSTFTTENVFGTIRPVRTFDAGNGLRLDMPDDLVSNSVYTIQMAIRIEDLTGGGTNFVKLIDYNNYSNDFGLYITPSILTFFDGGQPSGSDLIDENGWVQTVITRDADRLITAYIDGVEQFTYTAIEGNTDVTDPLIFLDDDTFTNGAEVSPGAIACLRIYDTALSGTEVANLDCRPLRVGLNGNACEFSTINEAVSAAQPGDTLFIEAGVYNERVGQIDGTDLTLQSSTLGSNCTEAEPFPGDRAVIDGTGFTDFIGTAGLIDLRNSALSLIQIELTNGTTGQGGLVTVRPGSSLTTFGTIFSNGTVRADLVNPSIPFDTDEPAGGCIYAEGATLDFSETLFTNCNVVGSDVRGPVQPDGDGGAIHARAGSTVNANTLVSFIENTARSGGAIAMVNSTLELTDVGLSGNVASQDGGALFSQNSSITTGFNTDWTVNLADRNGGAIALINSSTLEILDTARFESNNAQSAGGAIALGSSDLAIRPSSLSIEPTRFITNSATFGGAISFAGSVNALPNPTIEAVEFESNSASGLGGAMALVGAQNVEIVDSRFNGNSAGQAGAIYSQTSQTLIRSSNRCQAFQFSDPDRYCSEFTNNTSGNASAILYGDDSNGSAILTTAFVSNSGPEVIDLVNSSTDLYAESVWFFGNGGDVIRARANTFVDINHATFDNNTGSAFVGQDNSGLAMFNSIAFSNGTGGVASVGTGSVAVGCNIDQSSFAGPNINPQLTETADGLSHLIESSPAVDACTPVNSVNVDLDGRDRVFGTAADMGAFEFNDVLFEDEFEAVFGAL